MSFKKHDVNFLPILSNHTAFLQFSHTSKQKTNKGAPFVLF